MGEAARKFLDRLVLRVGGTASERARYRCYAEQRLACVNADGAARLVLSFKNHIRRRGGTVARTATDLRLPQVPEAPVNTHRPREATAVGPTETTTAPACQNFTTRPKVALEGTDRTRRRPVQVAIASRITTKKHARWEVIPKQPALHLPHGNEMAWSDAHEPALGMGVCAAQIF